MGAILCAEDECVWKYKVELCINNSALYCKSACVNHFNACKTESFCARGGISSYNYIRARKKACDVIMCKNSKVRFLCDSLFMY